MSPTPDDPYGGHQPHPPHGNPYGAPPVGYPSYGGAVVPDHQQVTTVLVLGILGLILCQLLAPFAWVLGNRVVREIDASGGRLGGRSTANVGRICGIVGSVLLGLAALLVVVAVVLPVVLFTASR